MKKISLLISAAVIIALLSIVFFNTKDNTQAQQSNLHKEYPSEWMYNQRAYPNNFINSEAIEKAIIQSNSILNNRSPQSSDWSLIGPLNTGVE